MSVRLLSMAELEARVREHPIRRALIPLECRSSWWVPLDTPGGKLYLAAFYYPVAGLPGQPKEVGRPLFHITVDPENARVVEFTDCRFSDFAAEVATTNPVGILQIEDAPARTVPEMERLHDALRAAYDGVLGLAFRPAGELTAAQCEEVARFRQLFERMTEPFMRPFYHALNPRFFAWLNQVC